MGIPSQFAGNRQYRIVIDNLVSIINTPICMVVKGNFSIGTSKRTLQLNPTFVQSPVSIKCLKSLGVWSGVEQFSPKHPLKESVKRVAGLHDLKINGYGISAESNANIRSSMRNRRVIEDTPILIEHTGRLRGIFNQMKPSVIPNQNTAQEQTRPIIVSQTR